MKKTLILIFLSIFFTENTIASQFGAGKINSFHQLKQGYLKYQEAMATNPSYNYVFAADNSGAWGYQGWKGGNAWASARQEALKTCNKFSSNNTCKVFAKGKKIFWKWDDMPDLLRIDKSKFINPNELTFKIGSGDVKLNTITKNKYNKFKAKCTEYDDDPTMKQVCYFAITKDGRYSGSGFFSYSGYGSDNIKKAKQGAIANCMKSSNMKNCFLYADEKKIIWDGNVNLENSTSSSYTNSYAVSTDTNNINELVDLSNAFVCRKSTSLDGMKWESIDSKFGDYVTEVFRRNLSLKECGKLTGRKPSEVNENIKPADSTGSIKGKLKELKVMLDEGLISQEQYNTKSEELIENF